MDGNSIYEKKPSQFKDSAYIERRAFIPHYALVFQIYIWKITFLPCIRSFIHFSQSRLTTEVAIKIVAGFYSQYTNPSMTAANPTLIPAISLPPDALPFVEVAEAAEPVALVVPDAVEDVAVAVPVTSFWPIEGKETSPSTNQPPAVDDGQAGGVSVGE